MSDMDEEYPAEDFDDSGDSGPFCEHWHDPADCGEVCVCGHPCNKHGGPGGCVAIGCSCAGFADPEEEASSRSTPAAPVALPPLAAAWWREKP